ncbi:hypothetical protein BDC45DRAFT_536866 [Circinella umbellata]|nr:hypothetical protein BDC45DRAFT_536862 [Circinella umbellata]KAI7853025.1 hypothetical protein BDC45DRAFT_536866 [Circinella umbellata]
MKQQHYFEVIFSEIHMEYIEFYELLVEEQEHKVQALFQSYSFRRLETTKVNGQPVIKHLEQESSFTCIDLTFDEQKLHSIINKTAQACLNKYIKEGSMLKKVSLVFDLLGRLQQACLHPSLVLVKRDEYDDFDNNNQMVLAGKMNNTVVNWIIYDNTDFPEIKCPICMDICYDVKVISSCGHMYYDQCINCTSST